MKRFAISSIAALALLAAADNALACACCADPGQRYVNVEKLKPETLQEIRRVRFAMAARLFTNDAGLEIVKGIEKPSDAYALSVTRQNDRFVFTFRDENKSEGT